jgi:hypothetical protein
MNLKKNVQTNEYITLYDSKNIFYPSRNATVQFLRNAIRLQLLTFAMMRKNKILQKNMS